MFLSLTNPDLRNSDTELFCTSSFPNMTMVITKCLCKKNFRDFSFCDFRHYSPLTPSQKNFDHLPHVLWFDGPDVILIQWLRLNRDFAISTFLLHWVLCLSMSRFAKLRYGVRSMVQIWSWFNGCDWITISHIAICCIVFFASPCCDSQNSDMELDQRFRSDLELTAQIKSRFRISWYRDSWC